MLHAEIEDDVARLRQEFAIERSEREAAGMELESLRWELSKKERHRANLAYRLKLACDHAANLENLRRAQARRIRRTRPAMRRISSARSRPRTRPWRGCPGWKAKLRTVQASFSWRVTVPLRYLRRKWIDPRVRSR